MRQSRFTVRSVTPRISRVSSTESPAKNRDRRLSRVARRGWTGGAGPRPVPRAPRRATRPEPRPRRERMVAPPRPASGRGGSGIVQDDLAHDGGRDSHEVGPILPGNRWAPHQLDVGLMDDRRSVERPVGACPLELVVGDPPDLGVDPEKTSSSAPRSPSRAAVRICVMSPRFSHRVKAPIPRRRAECGQPSVTEEVKSDGPRGSRDGRGGPSEAIPDGHVPFRPGMV